MFPSIPSNKGAGASHSVSERNNMDVVPLKTQGPKSFNIGSISRQPTGVSWGNTPNSQAADREVNLTKVNLPVEQVISSIHLLKSKSQKTENEWTSFEGEIRARHEPDYKLIRVYVGKSQEVVNVNLSEDGKKASSITGYPAVTPGKLYQLVKSGVFQPSILSIAGVSESDIQKSIKHQEQDRQLSQRLQTHDVNQLPSISSYAGTEHSTVAVGQGEGHMLSVKNDKIDGLYTAGAGPCLILAVVSKNTLGRPEKIAMAHVDAYVKDQALDQFLSKMHGSGTMEVTLLAGNQESSKRALRAVDKTGANVVFSHAGHTPAEGYSAAIDRNGKIYYGNKLSLSRKIDTRKTEMRTMRGMMSGGNLPTNDQLPVSIH